MRLKKSLEKLGLKEEGVGSSRGRGLGDSPLVPWAVAGHRECPSAEVTVWFVPLALACLFRLRRPALPAVGLGAPYTPSLPFAVPHSNNYHCRVLLAPGSAFYTYYIM